MAKNKQYLKYDFSFNGRRHAGRFLLDEDSTPNLSAMYDDHALEMTYIKDIRHKGATIRLNITLDDDAYKDPNRVVASAWVNVYQNKDLIASFEPDHWSYTDEADASHNTCKETFYKKTA